jgi:hypothetical protein
MKRSTLVEKLIKEGMSEKTLVRFTDKQLLELSERLLGEADIMISKKDPLSVQKIADAKKQNKSIETYEEENKEEYCDSCDCVKSKCKCKKSDVKEWVEKLVENKYHSFTSKNEIMELINVKLNESDTMVQHGPKVKKGHNGVPEFMTYDSIVDAAEPKTAPTTKPAPTKEPGTKPTPNKDPRKTPFKPGPGPNPKPKALKENKKSK